MTQNRPGDVPLTSGPKARLLLVDDQPSVLLTYQLILEQSGFSVAAVQNVADAVAALQREPFDLVVSDLALEPARSGFDVAAAARRLPRPPRCVLLTGYATPELTDRAAREDLVLLFKPIHAEELLTALRRLLPHRAAGAGAGG